MVTKTFEVPLDPHRVVSAKDTTLNRQQFSRQELETIYLPGVPAAEMTELTNVARNVFSSTAGRAEPSAGAMTVRAPAKTLDAFNSTMQDLLKGRSQVLLEVRVIQLAHTHELTTGLQPPQQVTAFNVYTEEQAILNANQALVQQIIASGLAAPGDTLAILGILIASGVVQNSIFSNGIALFGGGITLSGLSPQPATLHFALNSSDSRELDYIQLRLADGEDQTLLSGTRYPIQIRSVHGHLCGQRQYSRTNHSRKLDWPRQGWLPPFLQVASNPSGPISGPWPHLESESPDHAQRRCLADAGPENNCAVRHNCEWKSGAEQPFLFRSRDIKEGTGVVLMSELDRSGKPCADAARLDSLKFPASITLRKKTRIRTMRPC